MPYDGLERRLEHMTTMREIGLDRYSVSASVRVTDAKALADYHKTLWFLGADVDPDDSPHAGAAVADIIGHLLHSIPGVEVIGWSGGIEVDSSVYRFPGNVGDFVTVLVGDRHIGGAQLVTVDYERRTATVQFPRGQLRTYDRNGHYGEPIQSDGGRLYNVSIDECLIEEPF